MQLSAAEMHDWEEESPYCPYSHRVSQFFEGKILLSTIGMEEKNVPTVFAVALGKEDFWSINLSPSDRRF